MSWNAINGTAPAPAQAEPPAPAQAAPAAPAPSTPAPPASTEAPAGAWPFSNPAPSFQPPPPPPGLGVPEQNGSAGSPASPGSLPQFAPPPPPQYGPPPGSTSNPYASPSAEPVHNPYASPSAEPVHNPYAPPVAQGSFAPPAETSAETSAEKPSLEKAGEPVAATAAEASSAPAGESAPSQWSPPPPTGAPSAYPPPPPPSGAAPQWPGAAPANAAPGSPYSPQAAWNAPNAPGSPFNAQQVEARVPAFAWLVPVAALLAVIGVFTPWFRGEASAPGEKTLQFKDSLYSYADGKIGLLPPIALVVLAVGVVGLLLGKQPTRFIRGGSNPVKAAGRSLLIAGGISAICIVVAWFLVPSQYKFDDGSGKKVSWNDALDELHKQGIKASFSRGPQIGYWLTIAAVVIALVVGLLMVLGKGEKKS